MRPPTPVLTLKSLLQPPFCELGPHTLLQDTALWPVWLRTIVAHAKTVAERYVSVPGARLPDVEALLRILGAVSEATPVEFPFRVQQPGSIPPAFWTFKSPEKLAAFLKDYVDSALKAEQLAASLSQAQAPTSHPWAAEAAHQIGDRSESTPTAEVPRAGTMPAQPEPPRNKSRGFSR